VPSFTGSLQRLRLKLKPGRQVAQILHDIADSASVGEPTTECNYLPERLGHGLASSLRITARIGPMVHSLLRLLYSTRGLHHQQPAADVLVANKTDTAREG
jgi:hypothetical protein